MSGYIYEELMSIPEGMEPWNMRVALPLPSEFGSYALVNCQPAYIEQHHQVEVIDEDGRPLPDIWVIFGYPGGGPDLGFLNPRQYHWYNPPAVLRGNAVKTNLAGSAQHTFGEGGEDIWIWDLDDKGVLRLASTIVKNCTWIGPPKARFIHTGVHLRFQRRKVGVVPQSAQIADLVRRIEILEKKVYQTNDG